MIESFEKLTQFWLEIPHKLFDVYTISNTRNQIGNDNQVLESFTNEQKKQLQLFNSGLLSDYANAESTEDFKKGLDGILRKLKLTEGFGDWDNRNLEIDKDIKPKFVEISKKAQEHAIKIINEFIEEHFGIPQSNGALFKYTNKTQLIVILNAIHDLGNVRNLNDLKPTKKEFINSMLEVFDEKPPYNQLLNSVKGGSKENYLDVFDQLKKSAEDSFDKSKII